MKEKPVCCEYRLIACWFIQTLHCMPPIDPPIGIHFTLAPHESLYNQSFGCRHQLWKISYIREPKRLGNRGFNTGDIVFLQSKLGSVEIVRYLSRN